MTTTNRNLAVFLVGGIGIGVLVFFLYKAQSGAPFTTQHATSTVQDGTASSTGLTAAELAALQRELAEGLDIQGMVAEARALKNAGEYDAAIVKLNEAARIFPGNIVTYNNLADIYLNFKKDYAKAELNYKKVIQNDPRYLSAYRSLFELYTTTSYKPTSTAAVDIANAALKQEPKAYDFQVLLARQYKSLGDIANARVQYEAAIANATNQGMTQIATSLRAELDALPQ